MTDLPGREGAKGEGHHAWQLVQIADLLERAERLNDHALRILRDVDGDLPEDADFAVPGEEIAALSATLHEVAQLGERLQALAEGLPDAEVRVEHASVAAAATEDLIDGILDVDRAQLAAGLLDYREGWPALAQALRHADTHTAWEDATVTDVLASFRGAIPELVREAAARARLTGASDLARCEPDEAADLAASIERLATERTT